VKLFPCVKALQKNRNIGQKTKAQNTTKVPTSKKLQSVKNNKMKTIEQTKYMNAKNYQSTDGQKITKRQKE
jgi:hypothetical protein